MQWCRRCIQHGYQQPEEKEQRLAGLRRQVELAQDSNRTWFCQSMSAPQLPLRRTCSATRSLLAVRSVRTHATCDGAILSAASASVRGGCGGVPGYEEYWYVRCYGGSWCRVSAFGDVVAYPVRTPVKPAWRLIFATGKHDFSTENVDICSSIFPFLQCDRSSHAGRVRANLI